MTTVQSEARTVVDNAVYRIQDLSLYDSKGNIVFTVSITTLRPGKQTSGHKHANESEVYEFIAGYGTMMLDESALKVKPGDYIFVEPTKYHKVINGSVSADLVFKCYFNGEIKRPHLK